MTHIWQTGILIRNNMPCTVLVTDDELNKNQYYSCLYENCTLVGEETYSSKNNNNKFNIKNE